MISVAGVRGVVGDSLDPAVVARFSAAFARVLPGKGPVVIGRDARVTGPMVRLAACAGLNAAGRDVIDIGLATTPTTQLAVERLEAAGGVILTASHNPASWNALKFLSAAGVCPRPTGISGRTPSPAGRRQPSSSRGTN